MEFPTLINWTSLFQVKGVFGDNIHLYSNFDGTSCKQMLYSVCSGSSLFTYVHLTLIYYQFDVIISFKFPEGK